MNGSKNRISEKILNGQMNMTEESKSSSKKKVRM